MKKNTSLTINKATPRLRPFWTANVWHPKNVPSAATSRNHSIIANNVDKNPIITRGPPFTFPLKYITLDSVSVNRANDVINGQGEGSTRW